MRKASLEQANDLLQRLKLGVQVVADETEADTDFDVDAVTTDFYAEVPKQLPKEAKDVIISAELGKTMGTLRTNLSREFNLSKKDMEEKSVDELIKMAVNTTKGNKDADEQAVQAKIQEIRSELEAENAELRAQLEQTNGEWEGKLTAAQQRYIDRDINQSIYNFVDKYPSKGGDKNRQARALRRELEDSGIVIKYDEATKQNQYFDAKGKQLKEVDALMPVLEAIVPKATDTSHIPPSSLLNTPLPAPPAGKDNIAQIATPVSDMLLAGEQ